ncbi:endonuclease III [Rubinisphaera italica]|uniref:Endonuclease III n=1 Tax=Rubinisphaera italica TaxID=2527969 RepID=A0A5C5XLP6_9PLAN|nr:endonuclease III [Rubinisphaera italica]TWT64136.1 Ultraviolet N-glycosylase/AP lyase [Rubinisphaera italica]
MPVKKSTVKRRRKRRVSPEHVTAVVDQLQENYPHVECELIHHNAYELLVATILSAQCTDARVNQVTPKLFKKYPDPFLLSKAKQADVEKIIHSLGFFRAKATNLIGMAKGVVEQHAGVIPETLSDLTALPGVGRKTANVVLGTWFGIPSGVVVDTHVRRISQLLGLTSEVTPEKIEQDLMQRLPEEEWINFSHRLIRLGRQTCIARRPKCEECPMLTICPRVGLPVLSTKS